MRKTQKHKVYTIEEKNNIIKEYLNGEISREKIRRKYDISSNSVFHRWLEQYREKGTTSDSRGKSANGNSGRPRKMKPTEMTREELIKYVEATEDVKKLMAYLKRQKKNIK